MRVLLLFRGAPGCGKSTFIKEHSLEPYTLCADDIRLLCQSPIQNAFGKEEISQKNDKDVWATLFKLLDIRMSRGEFTVIDATNSKTEEMNKYKEKAEQYRYRMFCVDFTKLPIEECKRRNAGRPEYKRVPDEVIDKMYARFKTQKIPSAIKVIKPEELDKIFIKKFDMSKYEKIVHIGDVHGCYTALKTYFKDGFNDNYMYIFIGDYIDRGIENVEVVKFLIEISKKPNVLLLEGNHERWLWIYAHGGTGRSKEFELITKPQLQSSNIDIKDIRQLYRKLGQCAWYTYNDKEVLVTHGGIATMPENLGTIATDQFINGVGTYEQSETVADTWMETTDANQYQIFGHRNTHNNDIQMCDRVFNLEGKVEFGGNLRIVELDNEGFHTIEIKNDVFKAPEAVAASKQIMDSPVTDVVVKLRGNKYIKEKQFGNISSFNFTEKAFYNEIWNEQTVLARGLYINTNTMKIVARGFNKFFNINERPETKFEMLQYTLQFPVTCYVKENGYLGLVSYNEETDELFITSKSDPTGDFANWLRDAINTQMTETARNQMKDICKNENVTFVFENVDMKNDPHIIEYPENRLYLLAIIKNDVQFAQYGYEALVNIANDLNIRVKTKAVELADWDEFYNWYNEVSDPDYEYEGRKIEGFVIEDSAGYMVKAKLDYYKFWKFMRGIAHTTLRCGYVTRTGALTNALANDFYGFLKKLYEETDKEQRKLIPKDIIYLRNLYYNSLEQVTK